MSWAVGLWTSANPSHSRKASSHVLQTLQYSDNTTCLPSSQELYKQFISLRHWNQFWLTNLCRFLLRGLRSSTSHTMVLCFPFGSRVLRSVGTRSDTGETAARCLPTMSPVAAWRHGGVWSQFVASRKYPQPQQAVFWSLLFFWHFRAYCMKTKSKPD